LTEIIEIDTFINNFKNIKMKKLTLPKIDLSKKQILLICIPLVLLILLVTTFFILKSMGKINTGENTEKNQEQQGYADDSEQAQEILLQTYTPQDTQTTFKVYSDMQFNDAVMEMTESCSYTDNTEPTDTVYTVGPVPTEIKNHCLLSFTEFYGTNAFFKTDEPFYAYILLPDGSLITVTTKESPTIQVNIYEKETRIVIQNGYAYFRVAPQEQDHRFSVQMMDKVMYVTGTEFFAGTSNTFTTEQWGHIEMYEGSGEVKLRTQDLLVMLTNDDAEQYGEWVTKDGVTAWYWYWSQNGGSGKASTFYNNNVYEKVDDYGSSDKATAGYMQKVGNFIKSQMNTTLTTYGFGNYSSVVSQLEPFVDENIISVQELRYEVLTKEALSAQKAYDNIQAYKERLGEEAEEARKEREAAAKANQTVSVITSTVHKCPSGTAYVGNGKCCPTGTFLGLSGNCHKPGFSQSSATKPTTATSTTTSSGSSSGGSEDNCANSGTAMYQACSMALQGGSSGYYMSGSKCCWSNDKIPTPTMVPVE